MTVASPGAPVPRRTRRPALLVTGALAVLSAVLVIAILVSFNGNSPPGPQSLITPDASPASPPTPAETFTAAPPPRGLPVIDYGPAPGGFPTDPQPLSTVRLAEGLHPTCRIAAYDGPGGRPLAFLAPDISGVPLTMPIVQRRAGWAAVLLPSANRSLAWVAPGGWTTVPLRDQIVVARATHRLYWLRDDAVVKTWAVSLGHRRTPTPLGRTFILGRSSLPGRVYADTDVFALGAVPDNPDAVPTGLRGAHIGIHTWYNDWTLGQNVTDGCIRLTRKGQQELLAEVRPGTEVVVVDRYVPDPASPDPAR